MTQTTKLCQTAKDVPQEPHFAIIEFSTIYIPGDERSRTHPGHGYPESTEPISKYRIYGTEEEWKLSIQERTKKGDKDFVAIQANVAKITTEINVNIN